MLKIVLIFILLLASIPPLYSEELKSFVSMCIPSATTGFSWKKDHWQQANFKPPEHFIVKKVKNIPDMNGKTYLDIDPENQQELDDYFNNSSLDRECGEHVKQKPYASSITRVINYPVCVVTKKVNEKSWHYMKCFEEHFPDDFGANSTDKSLLKSTQSARGKVRINCQEYTYGELVFARDENFIITNTSADIFEPDDYKDSLAITVGTCSDISID